MNKIVENCLFVTDPKKFKEISRDTSFFTINYVGKNIIKSDIFDIAKNYVKRNDKHLEIFRLPIHDEDLCGFTCIRKGQIFMVINSSLPLNKQVFATAHELYHIYTYIANQDKSLLHKGSFLTSEHIEQNAIDKEDKQANAFAGLLLAPTSQIKEQMEIYNLDQNNIYSDTIIKLMNIFTMPYKAIVLRLYEADIIARKEAEQLLQQEPTDLNSQQTNQAIIDLGSIPTLINENIDNLPEQRIEEDKKKVEDIINTFNN